MTRVLMTADAVGGIWQHALTLAGGLTAHGVETTLAVLGPEPAAAQRRQAAAIGAALVTCPGRLEWMDDCWADVDRAGDWLLDLAARIRPDVVHLNGFSLAALPWTAPTLVAAHSCVCSWWQAVWSVAPPVRFAEYRRRVRRGLDAAGLIVTPTHAMHQALRAAHGPLRRVEVIANGLGLDARLAAPPPGEAIVLSVGRLWDDAKNVAALCDAAPDLPWPVVVAGDVGCGEHPAQGLSGVRTLGRVSDATLQSWYARASIYVHPARYEPFGLAVLEAAAAGCALVLGDIASLRENWSGVATFVPPGDARALAAAVTRLIDDRAARLELSQRARQRARRFTAARMVGRYLNAYRTLAAGRNRRPSPRQARPAARGRVHRPLPALRAESPVTGNRSREEHL